MDGTQKSLQTAVQSGAALTARPSKPTTVTMSDIVFASLKYLKLHSRASHRNGCDGQQPDDHVGSEHSETKTSIAGQWTNNDIFWPTAYCSHYDS